MAVDEKQLKKAFRIADKFYKKALKEKETKGIRENLGYDSYPSFTTEISKLDLHYRDECDAKSYFNRLCDSL